MHVKVIGAGSIGNHLTQASRRIGWDVTVVDMDPKALKRMREEIYPSRYGAWDEGIQQFVAGTEPKGEYDIIMVGTPPDVRMKVALALLKEKPKLMLLEKPLCTPDGKGLKALAAAAKKQGTMVVVGYDHAVSAGVVHITELLKQKTIGEVLTLDVEFREHWEGIFKAHPWLSGPQDTYLGYIARGGGASGEHSHALHLWQYLAQVSGMGTWKSVHALYDMKKAGKAEYDALAAFNFVTDKKKTGRVIQDVYTKPTRKWARIQGTTGYIEWMCNGDPRGDVVRWMKYDDSEESSKVFDKKRPDDFFMEIQHIDALLSKKVKLANSPIALEGGIRVIEVLKTAFSKRSTATVTIKKL